ncbi:hypothetical protein Acr_14g0003130 [Actinidia rufa]|uniref:Reverse transcriptase zinc-binding domain-containing protein n=1 Tax=Actinidia rufa TaxID=165716 RepID=A0A7J0FRX5_9ERIC|nr:hypothetical protein Acr_14g0003130 [Actinidia rufa]
MLLWDQRRSAVPEAVPKELEKNLTGDKVNNGMSQKVSNSSPWKDGEKDYGAVRWMNCEVGFLDKKLPCMAVKTIASIWLSEAVGVLKQWKSQMNFEIEEFTTIPVWFQFFNVPLDYWTEQGHSYIASAVGRPLYADAIAEAGKSLGFAKICVEIEVDSILPSSFDLRFANGESVERLIKLPMEASLSDHSAARLRHLHISHRVGESVRGMLLFQLLIPLQFLSLLRVMGTWIQQSRYGLGIIAPPETVQTSGSGEEVSPLAPVDSSVVLLGTAEFSTTWAVNRRALWDELRILHGNFGSEAWLLWGDFNSIRSVTEKSYVENLDMSAMVEFNGCVGDVGTEDLTAKGFFFTWSRRGGDHCPIAVTILPNVATRKPLKFFDFWMNHPDFANLLGGSWSQEVRVTLVREAKADLNWLQGLGSLFPVDPNLVLQEKEALLKRMTTNRMRNKILCIYDGAGQRIEDPCEIKKVIVGFYQDFLGTEFAERREGSRILQDLSIDKVPEELKMLIMPVSAEDTRRAMFSIKDDKAPGPDGFNASFSHNNWDAVGTDVVLAAQSFFSTGFLLKDWNSTALNLVPKTGLCGADPHSIAPVKEALDDFFSMSGLKTNLHKSAIFVSGVVNDLREILPITIGTLPVKYLGVPLISSRLTYDDRFMQVYWSSIFILPKKILKEVESILKAFLWTGAELKKSGAKVQWFLGSSWTVRKLFKLRDMVQSLIKSMLGMDVILSYGLIIGTLWDPFTKGLEKGWQRNRAIMYIMAHTPQNLRPNVALSDKVVWAPANDGFYTVKSAWKSIRLPKPKVPWYVTDWFKGQVPKWEFVSWLCCLGRLTKKDRLTGWGMGVSRSPNGWSEELAWANGKWIHPGFNTALFKLVLSGSVYHIWGEK